MIYNNAKLGGSWYKDGWGEDKGEDILEFSDNNLFNIRKFGRSLYFLSN